MPSPLGPYLAAQRPPLYPCSPQGSSFALYWYHDLPQGSPSKPKQSLGVPCSVRRCVIRGCVPKKLLMYGSHYNEDLEDARGFGWDVNSGHKHNWAQLVASKV